MFGQIDAKAAKVIQIDDIDIDLQGSYKYLRIPQANTNYDKDAAHSQIPPKSKTGTDS